LLSIEVSELVPAVSAAVPHGH